MAEASKEKMAEMRKKQAEAKKRPAEKDARSESVNISPVNEQSDQKTCCLEPN